MLIPIPNKIRVRMFLLKSFPPKTTIIMAGQPTPPIIPYPEIRVSIASLIKGNQWFISQFNDCLGIHLKPLSDVDSSRRKGGIGASAANSASCAEGGTTSPGTPPCLASEKKKTEQFMLVWGSMSTIIPQVILLYRYG